MIRGLFPVTRQGNTFDSFVFDHLDLKVRDALLEAIAR